MLIKIEAAEAIPQRKAKVVSNQPLEEMQCAFVADFGREEFVCHTVACQQTRSREIIK